MRSGDDAHLVDLVKRMAIGDDAALGELYDASVGRANGIARRILRSVVEAEEVIGDVYHQVWRQAQHFDPARGTVSAWIATIARARALDRLRQRDALADGPSAATRGRDTEESAGPEDLLLAVERGGAVHAALAQLTPMQRDLLSRAFFGGLSHAEIAAERDLPLGTVKTHIRRGLLAMRETLAALAPDGSGR